MLLPRIFHQQKNEKISQFSLQAWLNNYAVVAVIWILFIVSLINSELADKNTIQKTLSQTEIYRKYALSTLLFASIFLKSSFVLLKNLPWLKQIFWGFYFRSLAGLFLLMVLITFSAFSASILGLLVLICMPPSSMLPSMAESGNLRSKTIEEISNVVGAANFIFLFIIIGIVFLLSAPHLF
jgi:hypothetical protein